MIRHPFGLALSLLFAWALAPIAPPPAAAQLDFLPPPGDNQVAEVTQWMGPVSVTVRYSSPDVHSPTGEDRSGRIWGELVPWGMAPNPFYPGFGSAESMPWRGGANMNTTLRFSHDVEVEGQRLAAGTYGLHFVPGQEHWQVIFSNDARSWGSFFYDPAEDALRVTVEPEPAEYREWLAYDFVDRQLESSVLALHWERLRVPIRIAVPDVDQIFVRLADDALGGGQTAAGFWQNWDSVAQLLLSRQTHPEKALEYAQRANQPGTGGPNFQTLSTLSQAQAANGQQAEADATLQQAVGHLAATPVGIHQMGRQLLAQGRKDDAMRVFQINYDRFDGAWPTEVGMARGLSALGRYAEALEHVRKALEQARERGDALNATSLESLIPRLEAGEDIN